MKDILKTVNYLSRVVYRHEHIFLFYLHEEFLQGTNPDDLI